MPQCVQNTFKNDLKMAANGQVRATCRNQRPRGLQVKIQSFYIWQNFVEFFYTLQITSFQMTKLMHSISTQRGSYRYMSNRVWHI